MGKKTRGPGAWNSVKGWKEVDVGDAILTGSQEFGFMGLEELDPSSLGIYHRSCAREPRRSA
jgi:hypothetical protein